MSWGNLANADPEAAGAGRESNWVTPADGVHQASLVHAEAFISEKGDAFVKLQWQVLGGPQNGYEWDVLSGARSPEQANFTAKMCVDLGTPDPRTLPGIEALDTALRQLVGTYYMVKTLTKPKKDGSGMLYSTYIEGKATAIQSDIPVTDAGQFTGAPATGGTPVTADEVIPF